MLPLIMAGLSALGGSASLGGALGGIAGGVASALGARDSACEANQMAKFNYKHRYQWQMEDMRKAGINPMLAYGTSAGSVPQADVPNIGEAAIKGTAGAQSARMAAAQTDNLRETTETTRLMGNKTAAEGRAQEMANLVTEASPLYQSAKATLGERGEVTGTSAAANERWAADLTKTKNEAEKVAADTAVQRLQADLQKGELSLQQVRTKYADELAQVEVAYRQALKDAAAAGVPAAVADAEFWTNAGDLAKWASFIKGMFK